METTEKKPNGGYSRLKVKYAKLKAEKEELEKKLKDSEEIKKIALEEVENRNNQTERLHEEINELKETIRKQGTKISQLSADLAVAHGNEDEWQRKYNEAVRCMGSLRRWWYGM